MLPAHGYPGLKKYKHLVGNYGGAWQDQRQEFDKFPGAILMTTNCLQKPKDSYKDRIFTCGVVGWEDVVHIDDRDFTLVIKAALAAPGFVQDEPTKFITVGFAHNAVLGVADKVVEENWEDSYLFRVGLQYQMNENFTLRGGFLYDKTPQPVETMDPILPDSDRWALTAGFGFKVGSIVIDAAYQYEPFKDRTSPNRDIYLNNPIPGVNAGLGTYSTTAHLFGVSFGFVF